MKPKRVPDDMVLSESEVREVIERAARELPASSGITVAELRQIAAELDIAPAALARALDQVVGLPAADQPIRSWVRRHATKLGRFIEPFLPQRGRAILGALFGGLAGWMNAFLMNFSVNSHYPVALAMVGITLINLLSRRRDRKFGRYLAEILALWVTYTASWSVTYGGLTQNLAVWFVFWTCLAAALGWALVHETSDGSGGSSVEAERTIELPSASAEADPTLRVRVRPGLSWVITACLSRA